MTALEELPEKDKDFILPIIPLKGWVGSIKIDNSMKRIEDVIKKRFWIADIDRSFIDDCKEKKLTGEYPREVFYSIEELLSPDDGYKNWFEFIKEFPSAIPTVQLEDTSKINKQLKRLSSLNRGIAIRFTLEQIDSGIYREIIQKAAELNIDDLFILIDYGQVSREILSFAATIISTIERIHQVLPDAIIVISCSSFPSSFSGYSKGEHSIYERLLFNNVSTQCDNVRMIYSDRGSSRADKIGGGGGIPSPRIDYPLKNDWQFVRMEFDNYLSPEDGEKEKLYKKVAQKIINSNYWKNDLHIWGTRAIELTSKGDKYGIYNPMRSTAARINIHLHQQLHYNASHETLIDTDEDWED